MEKPISFSSGKGLSPESSQFEPLQKVKERLLTIILYGVAILGLTLFFLSLPGLLQPLQLFPIFALSAIVAALLLAAFLPRLIYLIKVIALAAVFLALGIYAIYSTGIQGYGLVFLIAFVAVLFAFSELFVGIAGTILGLFVLATMTVLSITNIYQPLPYKILAERPTALEWTAAMVIFLGASAFFGAIIYYLQSRYLRNLNQYQRTEVELATVKSTIEKINFEGEKSTQKRNQQIEVAGLLGRQISNLQNPQTLLEQAVNLIRDNFTYYQVNLFLLDPQKEYALLKAATGEAGKIMLERQHKLRVGEVGIVGNVAKQGDAHIASDVGTDAVHFRNPLLPETRSEIGLPLKVGDEIIGVLDVQSKQEAAFTQDDVKILQIVADQLATAIHRADLDSRLQRTVQELQTSARSYTRSTWESFLKKSEQLRGYKIANGKETHEVEHPTGFEDVIRSEKPIIRTIVENDGKHKTMVQLPFKLREQPLGFLDLQFDTDVLSNDVLDFLQTTGDRLALALENARLLEEIQDRANQEHIVRGISEKVTSSPDINDILKMAAEEIGKSLGISSVRVALASSEKDAKQ